ncbi:hypothetical protein [Acetobacter indonesiensis]|uniref:hypothetical protein n=1 Tax=Acetobacter indonesiensis TaxID=104101 RepID=UPI000A3C8494|nr:hypothetical protein [Acetobacter indonesiensis]
MTPISQKRFDALAGYTRLPATVLTIQEAAWFSTLDERLLGLITWDRFDYDYGWIVLGRDQRGRFRAIDQDVSHPTFAEAQERLAAAIENYAALPDESYYQGDEKGPSVDFFTPTVAAAKLNPTFKVLVEQERFSPARELITAMMPFFEDADGNFVEQFQTTGFDPRLWELYLFATFTELGYAHEEGVAVPDFLLTGPRGRIAIEATTANPPQVGAVPQPTSDEERRAYLENYVQIKLARALSRKLYHKQRYWNAPRVDGAPFVIALQDFHAPATMTWITPLATEYVFGVRHSMVEGKRHIERLTEHVYGNAREPSNFFKLPESENVSAVLLNPQGTLTKFNRLGYIAGFGNRDIRMIRSGFARGERNRNDPRPTNFSQDVCDLAYAESWVEGTVVLHNPNARIPLDPELIPGANHEFLRPDGRIMSLLPDFQPYFSRTIITLEDDTSAASDEAGAT